MIFIMTGVVCGFLKGTDICQLWQYYMRSEPSSILSCHTHIANAALSMTMYTSNEAIKKWKLLPDNQNIGVSRVRTAVLTNVRHTTWYNHDIRQFFSPSEPMLIQSIDFMAIGTPGQKTGLTKLCRRGIAPVDRGKLRFESGVNSACIRGWHAA